MTRQPGTAAPDRDDGDAGDDGIDGVDRALRALARQAPALDAPPPLGAALEAALGELAPVATRRPGRQLAATALAALAAVAALLLALRLRRDLRELPLPYVVAVGAAWLGGALAPAALVLVPRRGAMLPRWRGALAVAAAAALGFVALGLAVHPAGPSSRLLGWARLLDGRGCLALGVLAAVAPVVVAARALRGALPVAARATAAALGAAGGCAGGLMLHLHCPIADGPHVGLVHGGVVAVAAALAAALAPRLAAVPVEAAAPPPAPGDASTAPR